MNFKDMLQTKTVNEGISSEAKEFMKKFNEQIKFLKEDIQTSDANQDWLTRLESIKILIDKTLK